MDISNDNLTVVTREFGWHLNESQYICTQKKYFLSEVFEINLNNNKTKWQIILCKKTSNDYLYAFLHKIESSSNDFVVKFWASTCPGGTNVYKYYTDDPFIGDWNQIAYLSTTSYNSTKYIEKIFLKFKIELKEISKQISADNMNIVTRFEKLFISENSKDFTFICSDGKKIPAHRLILTACSPVMAKMLEVPMKESESRTAKIEDINGDTMLELLRFMYAGRIENPEVFAPKLLYCAEKYEIEGLKEICGSSMIKNLSLENALEYFVLAKRYYVKILLKRCILFIKSNYDNLRESEDWNNLDEASYNILEAMIDAIHESTDVHMIKAHTEKDYLSSPYKALI